MAIYYDLIAVPMLIGLGIITLIYKVLIDKFVENVGLKITIGLTWSIGLDAAATLIRGKLYWPLRLMYGLYLALSQATPMDLIVGFNTSIAGFFGGK